MRKKQFALLLSLILLLSGCAKANTSEEKAFAVEGLDVEFMVPESWEEQDKANFDFKIKSRRSMMMGFVYYLADFTQGQTPQSIFDDMEQQIMEKRENPKIVTADILSTLDDKTIHSDVFTARKEGVDRHYYASLIEFKGKEGQFVCVVFVTRSENFEKEKPIFDKILQSAKQTGK